MNIKVIQASHLGVHNRKDCICNVCIGLHQSGLTPNFVSDWGLISKLERITWCGTIIAVLTCAFERPLSFPQASTVLSPIHQDVVGFFISPKGWTLLHSVIDSGTVPIAAHTLETLSRRHCSPALPAGRPLVLTRFHTFRNTNSLHSGHCIPTE